MKYIFLFFIISLTSAFSGEPNCDLLDSTLEYNQLKCLNKNLIANEIRRNFEEAINRHAKCLDCVESFPEASKYLRLIGSKFIIIGFKENGYGGKFAYLFFNNSNMVYRVWAYPIDEDVYQVRELISVNPSEAFKKEISTLTKNPQILSLWL